MSRRFTVLGHPLKHTMSPPIHHRLFELAGKDGGYTVSDIAPEALEQNIPGLNSMGGYNITIPYKVEIIKYLDRLDSSAERYSSVNCVAHKDGEIVGFNTDCDGFIRALEAEKLPLDGSVLLLGCGGVGRTFAVETIRHGGTLTIAVRSRSLPDTEAVAERIRTQYPTAEISVVDIENISGSFGLMVNSTPVGMFPNIDGCPVSDEVISRCGALFDAIYNPVETLLMKKFRTQGKKALGGMSMLVWQAVVAHEIWDGSEYELSDIEALIREMEAEVEKDFPIRKQTL